MDKKHIRDVIYHCSLEYERNLCNQNLLLLFQENIHQINYVEIVFRSHNFLHFTGVIPRKGLSANNFYRFAKNHKLSISDFEINNNHTTELKIQILPSIMNIHKNARMIGDYSGPHLELFTEKVTGTTTACLGLIQKNNLFIPNSVLKEDIRNITWHPTRRILSIFRKSLNAPLYTELTYSARGFTITDLCLNDNIAKKTAPFLL